MLNVAGCNINFDGTSQNENGEELASFFATHYIGEALNLTIRTERPSSLKKDYQTWSADFLDFLSHVLEDDSFNTEE